MSTISTSSTTFPTGTVNTTTTEISDNADNWVTTTTSRITFLSVFVSIGFVGNLFLIITVCHSRRFRSVAFYVFVVNLAVVNICECVLNMSVLLSVSVINEWKFGEVACRFSAFFLNLVCIETVLGLAILTTDRMIATRFKDKYDSVLSTPRLLILVGFTWVQSVAFSTPIASGHVPSGVNSYINSCVISKGSSVVYSIFTALFCFVVPIILMIVFFFKIAQSGYRDRLMVRNLISQHNYNDDMTPEPQIKVEIRNSNIAATVCITWLVLEGPYIVTSYFSQFQHSSELEGLADQELRYVWYVDLVLLWLRFSDSLALPIAVFAWNKDVWKSFKDIILCRKNNSIVDESGKKTDWENQKMERKIKDEEKAKEKDKLAQNKEQRVFHVPVLFATSHGVHIQNHNIDDESEHDKTDDGERTGTLRGKKCDVIGSRDNLNNVEDDTSDYDSGNENDIFSVSHPISVRQIPTNDLSNHHRSVSEPEVREKNKANKTCNTTVGSTSAGDSGVDLSTSTYKSPGHKPLETIQKRQKENVLKTDSNDSGTVHDASTNRNTFDKISIDYVNEKYSQNTNGYKQISLENDHSDKQNGSNCHNNENIENNDTGLVKPAVKTLADINKVVTYSPITRRKKKKKRDKDTDSRTVPSVPSSPLLPPRPPPRLAPIAGNNGGVKTLYSGTGRPGSSCSSRCSFIDNNAEGIQPPQGFSINSDSVTDMMKTDLMSCDNVSISSFSVRRNVNDNQCVLNSSGANMDNHSNNEAHIDKQNHDILEVEENDLSHFTTAENASVDAQLDCKCSDQSNTLMDIRSGSLNAGYERLSGVEHEELKEPAQNCIKNTEARRKRRDKLASTSNSLLNEGKGYTILVPETP